MRQNHRINISGWEQKKKTYLDGLEEFCEPQKNNFEVTKDFERPEVEFQSSPQNNASKNRENREFDTEIREIW